MEVVICIYSYTIDLLLKVWMVDDSMLVLKGGSTKSDKVGYEDVWEPLDDYQAPYREPILPPNPNGKYTFLLYYILAARTLEAFSGT